MFGCADIRIKTIDVGVRMMTKDVLKIKTSKCLIPILTVLKSLTILLLNFESSNYFYLLWINQHFIIFIVVLGKFQFLAS